MVQPSELQILILAIALSPLMVWAFRGIDLQGKFWLAAAITAMVGSYICTVAEGFFLPEFLDFAEHALYAIAGMAFVGVAVSLWRAKSLFEPEDVT